MRVLYFDCASGISGDMTLGALVDAGVELNYLKQQLRLLGIDDEFEIRQRRVVKNGVSANKIDVVLKHHHHHHQRHDHEHHHHGRNFDQIKALITQSGLPDNVKAMAVNMFLAVGKAEAKVHGQDLSQVHFHEVGAVDSIVDIVGCAICIDKLSPDKIYCSTLCEGTGTVLCQHGVMPVPAPATLEILKQNKIPFAITSEQGEMITPTGAAIVAILADSFGAMPVMTVDIVGYGGGDKDFTRANILRVMMGEVAQDGGDQEITLIQTNIDDATPENIAFAVQTLFDAGALDVYTVPIYMKKGRIGTMLCVIIEGEAKQYETIIFKHTTSIGLRKTKMKRTIMQRKEYSVDTPYGPAMVKECQYGNICKIYPTFDDCVRIAQKNDLSFDIVYKMIQEICAK